MDFKPLVDFMKENPRALWIMAHCACGAASDYCLAHAGDYCGAALVVEKPRRAATGTGFCSSGDGEEKHPMERLLYKRFLMRWNMKDGFNIEVPASRRTDEALAFLLRCVGFGAAFVLFCWGLALLRWW